MRTIYDNVIRAWLDGADVQCRYKNCPWRDFDGDFDLTDEDWQYRIKPKVLKFKVAAMSASSKPYTVTASDEKEAKKIQSNKEFLFWISEWSQVEVEVW